MNPSISFFVSRESKEEIDALWEKLAEGGKALMPLQEYPFSKYYGWIQDRFGVSWQIILPDPDGDWRPALVPSLLFVGEQCGRAEEAIELYTSVFPESQKGVMARYAAGMEPDREGTLMYADFKICDQWFAAMDSAQNHEFGFSEGLSLMVTCRDQAEVDAYWEKLSAVPAAEQCGWLKDKFGVSWQIIPEVLAKLVGGEDSEKANRAMDAMLQMKKIDIAALEAAYNGE